ncbi:MAG: hypothetical protein HOH38_10260 [Nitrospinaceae bacterium]|nr:hypothetical protein [Nitrospinaceae bacterium]
MDRKLNAKASLGSYTVVFLFGILVFALRNSLNGVFYPNLLYEDGTSLFQPFYNGRELSYIFDYWNGYLYIVPKVIAYLLSFFPASLIPHFYALVAMLFAAITFVILFEMLQNFFEERFAFFSTLILVVLPLGYHHLITSLSFMIWNIFLVLVLLYFIPVPQSKYKRWFYSVAGMVMAVSHPLAVLMLPLYLYRLRMDPQNKWVHGLFALAVILYFGLGMVPKAMHFSQLSVLYHALMGGVVVGSIFGPIKTASFIIHDSLSVYGAMILVLLFALWGVFWSEKTRGEKELFFVSLYLIVSTVSISMLAGNYNEKLMIPWEMTRYLFVARVLFWVLLFSACLPLIRRSVKMIYLCVLLMGLVLIANTLGPYNGVYKYYTSNNRGKAVLEFVSQIPAYKEECQDSEEKEFILKQGGTGTMFDVRVKGCDFSIK